MVRTCSPDEPRRCVIEGEEFGGLEFEKKIEIDELRHPMMAGLPWPEREALEISFSAMPVVAAAGPLILRSP